MKNKIQLVCSLVFIITFIKGFFSILNIADITILLCMSVIFIMQEYINNTKLKKELEELREDTNSKVITITKALEETRSYVSKFSANAAFTRR